MLNVNQVVLIEGYLAVIKAVYSNYVEVSVNFHGKVINTVVELSKVKTVESKAKYSKDDQYKMFGRVFSLGFISIELMNLSFENVWGLTGDALRVMTTKKVDMLSVA